MTSSPDNLYNRLSNALRDHERKRISPDYSHSRFQREAEVRRNSFYTLYRARDRSRDCIVALKVFHPEFQIPKSKRLGFLVNWRGPTKLKHDHIVRILDAGEDDGRLYQTTEWVEGGELEPGLDRSRLLSLIELSARALHYAHESGVMHGHLSRTSLLFPGDTVKLTDFGLGALPESPKTDERKDVRDLGALLYEGLLGVAPENNENLPRKKDSTVSIEVDTIVAKAMDPDPGRRYETCEALAEDLRRHQAGEPIQARPASWISRLGRKLRS